MDLGTGSGCIPIALASELKKKEYQYNIIAVDKSEEALKIAKENSQFHITKVEFRQSDWFSNIYETFDLIISNPPYVNRDMDGLGAEIFFEPENALYFRESRP